jgi:uncharacterized protein RhaS with RHS repeats
MNRYYDPATDRYLTSDPIGLAGGINPFIYANANPLRFIDPYGLYCLTAREINAIAGGIGGVFSGATAGAVLASPTGPAAVVSAVVFGALGGGFGAAFGYLATSSEGHQVAAGIGNAVVAAGGSPLSHVYGGAIAGSMSSALQSNGVRDTHAGIIAGGAGGTAAAGSAAFFSAGAPSSVPAAISFAIKSALKGGLAGVSGAALSAAVAEGLRAGNDCGGCNQ